MFGWSFSLDKLGNILAFGFMLHNQETDVQVVALVQGQVRLLSLFLPRGVRVVAFLVKTGYRFSCNNQFL